MLKEVVPKVIPTHDLSHHATHTATEALLAIDVFDPPSL